MRLHSWLGRQKRGPTRRRANPRLSVELLEDHLGHCVTDAIAAGGPDAAAKVVEASDAIRRLVRS